MSQCGSWKTADRFYSYDCETFTKRELFPHERMINARGEIIRRPWTTERLQNEYAALKFIAANTSIPVPKVLSFELIEGSYELVVERIYGKPLHHFREHRTKALENAPRFITTMVLPQLSILRSTPSGGVVIPPDRVTTRAGNILWKPRSSVLSEYVFCHNDLAQPNILMNPETLQVEAIIDWEYSGFYPPDFEAPLWTKSPEEPGH